MTTVPTLNFIHVIDFANYTVFENHTLVVGKWLLYLSKVTIALSVVFFWIFRGKCSFSSPISHVHTRTIVHKMDMSDMIKDLKAWWKLVLFKKIHTRYLKCSFHLTGTKMKKGRAGCNMAIDWLWTLYITLLSISWTLKKAHAS